jgi:hypothetical protein
MSHPSPTPPALATGTTELQIDHRLAHEEPELDLYHCQELELGSPAYTPSYRNRLIGRIW